MLGTGIVAAVRNDSYSRASMGAAITNLIANVVPSLPSLIRHGDRALVKVSMGCSGLRSPSDRVTTHPILVEAIIRALQDCGAQVCFGDDVARVGKHCRELWIATEMQRVADAT